MRDAGLVREEWRGRQNFYHLDAGPLREVSAWVAEYEQFWKTRLQSLSKLLDEEDE